MSIRNRFQWQPQQQQQSNDDDDDDDDNNNNNNNNKESMTNRLSTLSILIDWKDMF